MSKKLYIVGCDGSEWGERAASCAVKFAQDSGARIRLIYAIDWSGMRPVSLEEIAHSPPVRAEEERKATEEILAPLVEKYANSNVEIESAFIWGDPAEVLHDEAERQDANMIFVGRHGRSSFADMLLGSAANKLAHMANVPVVLVPQQK
jgi:nucleotide-binding universal stress UspA family protein